MFVLGDLLTSASGWAAVGLGVLAIAAAFMYLGGPLLIYLTHKQSAHPNLVAFKPGVTPLPADVDHYFHGTSWALAQQGFEMVTGVFLPSQVENVVAALVFMVNRQERDSVIAVTVHNRTPGMTTTMFHCEFVTRYQGGRVIQTNNAQPLNAFPIPPQCTNTYLPSVHDPVELYRLHQAVCRRHGTGQKVLPLDEQYGGDALSYMATAIIEELDEAAKAGVMRLDVAAGAYRPTLSGALRMTYAELWPMKGIRLRQRAKREREILAELAYETAAARAPGLSTS